jgi:hypothetical protein
MLHSGVLKCDKKEKKLSKTKVNHTGYFTTTSGDIEPTSNQDSSF